MIETARNPTCPKVSFESLKCNTSWDWRSDESTYSEGPWDIYQEPLLIDYIDYLYIGSVYEDSGCGH